MRQSKMPNRRIVTFFWTLSDEDDLTTSSVVVVIALDRQRSVVSTTMLHVCDFLSDNL